MPRVPRLLVACVLAAACAAALAAEPVVPRVDHHQHLLSTRGALLLNTPEPIELPAAISAVLRAREAAWNDADRLAPLYTGNATLLHDADLEWLKGRQAVAGLVATRFARPYDITPVAWLQDGDRGHLALRFSRGKGEDRRDIGSAMMGFVRDADGTWRIATEYPHFPGPARQEPIDAGKMVAMLDAAGIDKAVLLSIGYWFQSPEAAHFDPAWAQVEDDWTADQAALHPDRLIAFCSLNPLHPGAPASLAQCLGDARFRGIKLHLANAALDVGDPAQVAKLRGVLEAANRAGKAVVIHTRGPDAHEAAQARVLIEQVLPAAPDVPVQIAHLWGGGAYAPDVLAAYAQAFKDKLPVTRRLYFDVSDVALAAAAPEQAATVAQHMRVIGLDRMLYGSDAAYPPHPDPKGSWEAFRKVLPLTEAEFARIAGNVAPYLR